MYNTVFYMLKTFKCVCIYSSHIQLFVIRWAAAHQPPLCMESDKNTGIGCHFLLWIQQMGIRKINMSQYITRK